MIPFVEHTLAVGRYLLSPRSQADADGQYAASVTIRSGRGSGTHAKVYRFVPRFATSEGALQYALDQGHNRLLQPV